MNSSDLEKDIVRFVNQSKKVSIDDVANAFPEFSRKTILYRLVQIENEGLICSERLMNVSKGRQKKLYVPAMNKTHYWGDYFGEE